MSKRTRGNGGRALVGALTAAAALLALGPASASAAGGCTTPPGEPTVRECTYTFPISVNGYEVLQDFRVLSGSNFVPQEEGSITKMETDIVDDQGNPLPISRLMLHHIVLLNIYEADNTCNTLTDWDSRPSGLMRQRFFAAGEERAKMSLPEGYGYQTAPSGQAPAWGVLYMVMNHREVTDEANVQYTVRLETDDAGLKQVEPYWMDVNDCHVDPFYNVPGTGKKGSVDVESKDLVMPESGRIVAGIGHVHGGAYKLALNQPACGNRELAVSNPTWGNPDHPFYNVRPILHEPGPTHMTAFKSVQGIPVNAGETIRLNSIYDNSYPHTRVMGISQIYVDPDPTVTQNCSPLPGDIEEVGPDAPGRSLPPRFIVPLTGLDSSGKAVTIKKPPGKTRRIKGGATIPVGDRFFTNPNLKLKVKKGLSWRFAGNELHNVTLANGPAGIASENLDANRTFWAKFPKKGTYNFFCSLHPVQMHQRVVVTGKKKRKQAKGK